MTRGATKQDTLTPKTKNLVLAQTRVFAEQLSGHPLPVVKQLQQQTSPDSTVPRSRNKVVKLVMAELQNREDWTQGALLHSPSF